MKDTRPLYARGITYHALVVWPTDPDDLERWRQAAQEAARKEHAERSAR